MTDSPSETAADPPTTDTTASTPTDAADPPADEDGHDVRRRWVIRLLVGLGIGIPVAIEARTFLGLLSSYLLGDDGEGTAGTKATASPTPETGVGVGDELLSGTPATETVRESYIRVRESGWQFHLSVTVENTADAPYELRLGAVRTEDGDTADGGASTGRIPPGESATVDGTWTLPPDERPETVVVIALTYGDDVDVSETEVELRRVSTRG